MSSIHGTNNAPHHRRRSKTPSFSSILLDSIYRSFDSPPHSLHPPPLPSPSPSSPLYYYNNNINNINNNNNNYHDNNNINKTNNYAQLRRTKMRSDSTLSLDASLIDTWIHKHHHQHHDNHSQPYDHHHQICYARQKSVPSTSSPPSDHRPAPPESKRVSSSKLIFTKTKSRALKLYGDLRKSKPPPPQPPRSPPVSPGARFAAFLNSLFRNASGTPARSSNPTSTSTCSSASSFSRSCLSKTPSSRGKSSTTSTETKRSVRFYPLSVIVDEDSKPCGQKSLRKEKEGNQGNGNGNGNGSVKRAREKEIDTLMMMIKRDCFRDRGFESRDEHMNEINDDDDDESCGSSDLFELENFSSIGVSRYSQELPVYGTTSLHNLTA